MNTKCVRSTTPSGYSASSLPLFRCFKVALVSIASSFIYVLPASSQTAVVTNNSNPSSAVSTTTTGGTNINYQTNNQWSNENGFAPGIFCRTPTFYVGGGTGQNMGNTIDTFEIGSYQYQQNYNANVGLLVPFGSSVLKNCKRLAEQIASDREISSDLSMIRACAALDKEGILVDAEKFPTLSKCVINRGEPPLTVSRAKAMLTLKKRRAARKSPVLKTPKTEIIKN